MKLLPVVLKQGSSSTLSLELLLKKPYPTISNLGKLTFLINVFSNKNEFPALINSGNSKPVKPRLQNKKALCATLSIGNSKYSKSLLLLKK